MTPTASSGPVGAPGRREIDAFKTTGSSPGASHTIDRPLLFDHHGLRRARFDYEVQGGSPGRTVVVLGGISASRHLGPTPADSAPGWWPGIIGHGCALDPDRYRLIGIDYLGGPDTWSPGRPITTADQARAVATVLDELGIARASIVGASYGGMVAMALAANHPERVERLVVACASHRPHPMATALRALQRRVGRASSGGGPAALGVVLARALAMTTYRSAEEFDERFDHRPKEIGSGVLRFEVESYLVTRGRDFARRFRREHFECLSESIDLHDIDPGSVHSPTTLISVDSDAVVPPWLADELEEGSSGVVEHCRLSSVYGHDAFLKETQAVGAFIESALSTPAAAQRTGWPKNDGGPGHEA